MADDKAPWRDPNEWAKFCEMARKILTAADDIAAGLSTTAKRQPYSRAGQPTNSALR
jgi:hypothetical protein